MREMYATKRLQYLQRLDSLYPTHATRDGHEKGEHGLPDAAVEFFTLWVLDVGIIEPVLRRSLREEYAEHVQANSQKNACPYKGPQAVHDAVDQKSQRTEKTCETEETHDAHGPYHAQQTQMRDALLGKTELTSCLQQDLDSRHRHNQQVQHIPSAVLWVQEEK